MVIKCVDRVIKDPMLLLKRPALQREVCQANSVIEYMVEGACTVNVPLGRAQNNEVEILLSSSPEKETLKRGRGN